MSYTRSRWSHTVRGALGLLGASLMMASTQCGGGTLQSSEGAGGYDGGGAQGADAAGTAGADGATGTGASAGWPSGDAGGGASGAGELGDACAGASACAAGLSCTAGECIEDGAMRITLVWDAGVDLDLYVQNPLGEVIYYRNRNGSQGGEFLQDGCIGGGCASDVGELHESVVWDSLPTGDPQGAGRVYEFWAVNYVDSEAVEVRFEVQIEGRVETFVSRVGAAGGDASERFAVSLDDPAGGLPTVRFVSPADGATVENPVEFRYETANVESVMVTADDQPLASAPWDPRQQPAFAYTFNGVGYPRDIVLTGFDGAGDAVAESRITITVAADRPDDPGRLVGNFWNTYYYFAQETEYTGADSTTLYDASCQPIARVPASFSDDVCIQGSGKLEDGRLISFASTCGCGRPCPTGGTICYDEVDRNRYPWGRGSRSNAIEPLRSFAVDTSVIPWGSVLYLPAWDGVQIPRVGGLGGFEHDGCFHAADVGGWIIGHHFDFFAGTSQMHDALELIYPTRSNFDVFVDSPRCAHFRP